MENLLGDQDQNLLEDQEDRSKPKRGRKKRKFCKDVTPTNMKLKRKTKFQLSQMTLESYNKYASEIESAPDLTEEQHEIIVKERRKIMDRINQRKYRRNKHVYISELKQRVRELEQENIQIRNEIQEMESENRAITTEIVCLILEYNII